MDKLIEELYRQSQLTVDAVNTNEEMKQTIEIYKAVEIFQQYEKELPPTYTQAEVLELLRKQREICYYNAKMKQVRIRGLADEFRTEIIPDSILNAPLPDMNNKEITEEEHKPIKDGE